MLGTCFDYIASAALLMSMRKSLYDDTVLEYYVRTSELVKHTETESIANLREDNLNPNDATSKVPAIEDIPSVDAPLEADQTSHLKDENSLKNLEETGLYKA
jgi:hypothetical protein